jgi:Ni/Co efflux regulator RcnB
VADRVARAFRSRPRKPFSVILFLFAGLSLFAPFALSQSADLEPLLLATGSPSRTVAAERTDQQAGHPDHDQQVAHDWYNKHRDHPSVGFRDRDRLSAEEESRLQEGAVLDRNLRRKVHSVPRDLARSLPPPPRNHRYVAIGGHVGLIDDQYHVKAVIHLHE